MRRATAWLTRRGVLGGVALALAVVTLWPSSLGGPNGLVIVSGQSMEPTYSMGDLVVVSAWKGAGVGDVVVYDAEVAAGQELRVIHRVVGGDGSGWVTRGDNNEAVDPWSPSDGEVEGTAVLHVPGAGQALAWARSPLAVAGIGALATSWVFWPRRRGRHSA